MTAPAIAYALPRDPRNRWYSAGPFRFGRSYDKLARPVEFSTDWRSFAEITVAGRHVGLCWR